MQPSIAQDVRGAWCERGHQAIAEAQLATERDRCGLLHQQGIGTCIDDPAVEPIAADDTAEAIGGVEQTDADAAAL